MKGEIFARGLPQANPGLETLREATQLVDPPERFAQAQFRPLRFTCNAPLRQAVSLGPAHDIGSSDSTHAQKRSTPSRPLNSDARPLARPRLAAQLGSQEVTGGGPSAAHVACDQQSLRDCPLRGMRRTSIFPLGLRSRPPLASQAPRVLSP